MNLSELAWACNPFYKHFGWYYRPDPDRPILRDKILNELALQSLIVRE